MNRTLACILATAFLLSGGVVHGLYSDRWRTSHELEDAVAQVPRVPMSVGPWQAEDVDTDDAEFAQAGALGYWARRYRKNGQEILAILMVGRAGRMAIHTPEVCYRGAGYEVGGAPSARLVRDGAGTEIGTFWSARFLKPAEAGSELLLYWAWNDGSGWRAPTNPRWEFAGRPALYKLYFSHNVPGPAGPAPIQTMDDFLQEFMPALNETLIAGPR